MNGKKINKILGLKAEHAYYFRDGNWYHPLKKFPGILANQKGYVVYDTKEEYISDRNLKHGSRLHFNTRNGISDLPKYREFNNEQLNLIFDIDDRTSYQPIIIPKRKAIMVDSITRNQTLVKRIKQLREHICQICSEKLNLGQNTYYSEVHHIKPLGKPHNGVDVIENMICVCPNCHKKLDYASIGINFENIIQIHGHEIGMEYVEYHNSRIKTIS